MDAGKQNEISRKLNELEEIPPGFRFRKEAVWQSLEKNLQGNRRKTRLIPILAAAVVIAILVLTGIFIRKNAKENSLENLVKKESMPAPGKQNDMVHQNDNRVTLPARGTEVNRKINNAVAKVNTLKNSEAAGKTSQKEIMVTADPGFETVNPLTGYADLHPDSTRPSGISAKKRQFKVAHINELNRETTPGTDQWKVEETVVRKPLLASVNTEPRLSDEQLPLPPRKQKGIISFKPSSQ